MNGQRPRNVGIVAHVDAGKTTITENILYLSGNTRKIGSVDKGTTQTDWLEVERERGISVRASAISFGWRGTNVNLIDTPGHVDFSGEVERTLSVLDGAILVVSAAEGIEARTQMLWKALRSLEVPTIIFINKVDRVGVDLAALITKIRKILSPAVIPLQFVEDAGTNNPRVSSLGAHQQKPCDMDLYLAIIEGLADYSSEIMTRYINEEPIAKQLIYQTVASLTKQGTIFPVLFGSALKQVGTESLLDGIVDFLPASQGEIEEPLAGKVFRIEHDSTMGRVAYVRLYNGHIENRDTIYNHTQNINQKITQIRRSNGQRYEDIGSLSAGDIGAVCGMSHTQIGDILGEPHSSMKHYPLTVPLLKVQVYPIDKQAYPELAAALKDLAAEDPLLDLEVHEDTRELHIRIMGEIQLEVLAQILVTRFNLQVRFAKPSVVYKETPSRAGEGYVRYTMPKPCWAVLRFKIEPLPTGSGLVYSSEVRTEDILKKYQNQVEDTLVSSLKQGLYGWEVTDLKITLIDGEYHVEHTHPGDFIVATPMGIMDGLANTGTTLLEPVLDFSITVPEEVGGRVLGDIIAMRGTFDSPIIAGGNFTVKGCVPAATSLDYGIKLSSLSAGKGIFRTQLAGYQPCPLELGAKQARRGVDPLNRSKYILSVRHAL